MSRIVTVQLEVDENVFTSVALRKGYYCSQKGVITSPKLFAPIEIHEGKLKYDDMDVEKVSDLIAEYIVEQTHGIRSQVNNEIIIEI